MKEVHIMANANSTPIRTSLDRLKVREYSWGRIYQGTQVDLIASGLVKPEWFPGPGTAKNASRIAMVDGEMRVLPFGRAATSEQRRQGLVQIFKRNKREFEAWIGFNEEEKDRQRLKEEIEKQHAEKKRALDRAPKSPQDFREDRKGLIKACLGGVFNLFRRADNGYHYSREVIEQANDLMCDLLDLAEDGKVYFDPKRQQYFLDDIEKKFEKENPEFSAFMKATLAIGKAAL